MASRDAVVPSPRSPIVDSSGRIDPTWYRFLVDLHERTGGGATDKVETASSTATTATTAAATAQTTADAAQALAESIETSGGVSAEEIREIQFLGRWGGEVL